MAVIFLFVIAQARRGVERLGMIAGDAAAEILGVQHIDHAFLGRGGQQGAVLEREDHRAARAQIQILGVEILPAWRGEGIGQAIGLGLHREHRIAEDAAGRIVIAVRGLDIDA